MTKTELKAMVFDEIVKEIRSSKKTSAKEIVRTILIQAKTLEDDKTQK